jgi:hypothetical protein
MAAARAQVIRALLARCSAKCPRRSSSPSPSSSSAASFSSIRGTAPSPSAPSPLYRRLFPASQTQTRSLASEAARGGVGGREGEEEEEEEAREWAVEWEDSEDDGYDPEVRPCAALLNPLPVCSGLRSAAASESLTMHRLVLQIGDGGDGGGVVLRDVKWGERALAAAQEVLAGHFGDDVEMFAFKVSPKGYVYVRLDKLTNMSVTHSF